MFWTRIPRAAGAVPAAAALKAMAMVLKWSAPDPWATVSVGLMAAAGGLDRVLGDRSELSVRRCEREARAGVMPLTRLVRLRAHPFPGFAIAWW